MALSWHQVLKSNLNYEHGMVELTIPDKPPVQNKNTDLKGISINGY